VWPSFVTTTTSSRLTMPWSIASRNTRPTNTSLLPRESCHVQHATCSVVVRTTASVQGVCSHATRGRRKFGAPSVRVRG
jgi:hypothetical protein